MKKLEQDFFKPDVQFSSSDSQGSPSSSDGSPTEQSRLSWPLAALSAGVLAFNLLIVPMAGTNPVAPMARKAADHAPTPDELAHTTTRDGPVREDHLQAILGQLDRQEKPAVEPTVLARAERVAEALRRSPASPASALQGGVEFLRSCDD